jgi:hypothetical protein
MLILWLFVGQVGPRVGCRLRWQWPTGREGPTGSCRSGTSAPGWAGQSAARGGPRLVAEAHEERAQAISSPWAVPGGARCRGLLAGAEGDFPTALGVVRCQAQERRAAREVLD